MTVNLTGVTNAQTVTLTFSQLTDTAGRAMPDTSFRVSFLLGDSNGDALVNAADAMQVRSRSGQSIDGRSFSSDVNVDGSVNTADSVIVRAASGSFAP
jgi:hypothetical protein